MADLVTTISETRAASMESNLNNSNGYNRNAKTQFKTILRRN